MFDDPLHTPDDPLAQLTPDQARALAEGHLLVVEDPASGEAENVIAYTANDAGYGFGDIVEIAEGPDRWVGTLVTRNRNRGRLGGQPFDPVKLTAYRLANPDGTPADAAQYLRVFEVRVLGRWEHEQVTYHFTRPGPGAHGARVRPDVEQAILGLPDLLRRPDGTTNAIGGIERRAGMIGVPVAEWQLAWHFLLAGATGGGKSNGIANLVLQAVAFNKCVVLHDVKPDYGLIADPNSDPSVARFWPMFGQFGLVPRGAGDLIRLRFYQGRHQAYPADCQVLGVQASDVSPAVLTGAFFPGDVQSEQLASERFEQIAYDLQRAMREGERQEYTVTDILQVAREERRQAEIAAAARQPWNGTNVMTLRSLISKVERRQRRLPWLDAVGEPLGGTRPDPNDPLAGRRAGRRVQRADLANLAAPGRVLLVEYGDVDDASYALLMAYWLNEGRRYRHPRGGHATGLVQVVDEAHRLFENRSVQSSALESAFRRILREGRSRDHAFVLAVQDASSLPARVRQHLNSVIAFVQNVDSEARAATEAMGSPDYARQVMTLHAGHALVRLVRMHAPAIVRLAPSPFELLRSDNQQLAQQPDEGTADWWEDEDA
ncbi:MAG TPA: hypothetical protein VGJ60_33955 [Chloroflexota bacterium]|jgi:hypothetical protein